MLIFLRRKGSLKNKKPMPAPVFASPQVAQAQVAKCTYHRRDWVHSDGTA